MATVQEQGLAFLWESRPNATVGTQSPLGSVLRALRERLPTAATHQERVVRVAGSPQAPQRRCEAAGHIATGRGRMQSLQNSVTMLVGEGIVALSDRRLGRSEQDILESSVGLFTQADVHGSRAAVPPLQSQAAVSPQG